jgi:pSer/pThr/pTyr-binding forkhead associated (FHA) protein
MTAYLLRLHDRHLAGERFNLDTGEFVLGRSSSCHLVVHDSTISRRHAKIAVAEHSVTVTDLGSLNGTYLDEEQVRAVSEVVEGQTLRFGSVSFLLSTDQALRAELDSALETDKCDQLADGRSFLPALSQAQTRVLEQLLGGFGEKQIAARLCISRYTVHNHVRAIFQSFHVHSRAELLATFVRRDNHPTIRKMEAGETLNLPDKSQLRRS